MTRAPTRAVRRLRFSRREVLKLAQVGGLGIGVGALGLFGRTAEAETTAKGTCRFCSMHCGVVATRQGSRVVRVEGDPESPTKGFICLHGQSLSEVVHAKERLVRPLVREHGAFAESSWPVVLPELAARIRRVAERHGPESVAVQIGWPFVRHPLVPFFHRFTRALGSPNFATAASFCAIAGRIGRTLTAGSDFWPDLPGARTLFVWGANPTDSSPPFTHQIARMARRGHNLVVVDPVKTEVADRAQLFLQLRPGTDAALALGMMRAMVANGWYDRAYVEANTLGFEELRASLEPWTPKRVEAITSVPAKDVVEAARLFGSEGPSCIWECLGVEHHENGTQIVRALAVLQALAGSIDVKGGAKLHTKPGPRFWDEPLPGFFRGMTPEPVPPPVRAKPIGFDEYPLFEAFNRQAQSNLFERAILAGEPYPLRALLVFGANPLVTSPGAAKLREAYGQLELLVVADPFLTATGEVADFVLPTGTFAEAPSFDSTGKLTDPAGLVAAQGEAWPDWKILFELARALGLGEYFPWATLEEAVRAPRVEWPPDPDHTLSPDHRSSADPTSSPDHRSSADPTSSPDSPADAAPRFATPSGKVELFSRTLERFGQPPLPVHVPPAEAPTAERPLWLVTGPRTRAFINSQFHDTPSVRQKLPRPEVSVHPKTAEAAGLTPGQRVRIVASAGAIVMHLRTDPRVHPEVVVVPHGWAEANANHLTHVARLDPISGFPAMRSLTCRLERADGA